MCWNFVVLLIVEVPPYVWHWMSGLSRSLVREACVSVLVGGTGSLLSGVR